MRHVSQGTHKVATQELLICKHSFCLHNIDLSFTKIMTIQIMQNTQTPLIATCTRQLEHKEEGHEVIFPSYTRPAIKMANMRPQYFAFERTGLAGGFESRESFLLI